jgi:hypothetical protein
VSSSARSEASAWIRFPSGEEASALKPQWP